MKFDKAFDLLIGSEGGYTCDTRDNGNWTGGRPGAGTLKGTKYGISAYSYPAVDIKNLTLEEAKSLNKRDFWEPLRLDELPESVRFDLYDLAFNTSAPGHPDQAVKLLQNALGVVVDGKLGPKTLAAAQAVDPQLLDKRLSAQRLLFLTELKPAQWAAFGRGWVRRIAHNLMND